MRVTFQNNNYGIAVPQQVRDKLPRNDAANFTGKSDIAVKPAKSKLFEPLKAKFRNIDNKMTGWLTENYAKKLADNSVVNWVADKFKNDKYFYNHVTTVGSIITSGLYAHRTLKNDQLDKDRRNTLAINQLLTLGVSTAGAYTLDASMDKWWNRVTAGYAGVQLKDDA
ncbi:MAG: hypothetical protein LBJ74_05730, partial [Heliobacteriaceae bacterium]|nr:hypothetical protein [Heliobacteriaceae bacterium]